MNEWQNDPSNWIWGIFYFNKKDKRAIVPKRLPLLGITVNFANPCSQLILIGIIALIAITAKLVYK